MEKVGYKKVFLLVKSTYTLKRKIYLKERHIDIYICNYVYIYIYILFHP